MLLILLVLTIVFICYNTRDVFKNHALQEIDNLWDQEIIHSGSMDSKQIIVSDLIKLILVLLYTIINYNCAIV